MGTRECFSFLNQSQYFKGKVKRWIGYEFTVYEFGGSDFNAEILVPKNEEDKMYYSYCERRVKGYRSIMKLEETPTWFQELAKRTEEEIKKRDRVRHIFKQK